MFWAFWAGELKRAEGEECGLGYLRVLGHRIGNFDFKGKWV